MKSPSKSRPSRALAPDATIPIAAIATSAAILFALSPAALAAGDCRVIDGDTLACNGQRIRIWGLDCPEARTPRGEAASRAARVLVAGNIVRIIKPHLSGSARRDRYGRRVASVLIQRTSRGEFFTFDFACRMIADGYCTDYPRFSFGYYERCK